MMKLFNLKSLFSANAVKPELPSFSMPKTQIVTANQFFEPSFKKWACNEMGWQFGFNRKLWEYAFILNAIDVYGKANGRGVGFGVGREPIVEVLLRQGAKLVVSDLMDAEAQPKGWESMNFSGLEKYDIRFMYVDMNKIPDELRNFDFLWSCGSFEHIGGLQQGLAFVKRSLACLKPGGLAVHTTEYNSSDNSATFESPGLSIYRQKDIEGLAEDLSRSGHKIECNFTKGDHALDAIVSDETSPWEISLKVKVCGQVATSIGIVIHKGRA
jgi:hypothetical protein